MYMYRILPVFNSLQNSFMFSWCLKRQVFENALVKREIAKKDSFWNTTRKQEINLNKHSICFQHYFSYTYIVATKTNVPIQAFLVPYSPNSPKSILCLCLQDLSIWTKHNFWLANRMVSQSEVVLHSNAAKYRKVWRQRTFLNMGGEHWPWSFFSQCCSWYSS